MKRLALIIALSTTLGIVAQTKKDCKDEKMNMTVEEIATKRTEKLTETLDLNESQQEQVMQMSLESAARHKAKWEENKTRRENGTWEKPTSEQRSEIRNAMRERQKVWDEKMKDVLTGEQYAKWRKTRDRKAIRKMEKRQEREASE